MSRASGYIGVYYHKAAKKWAAQIRIPARQEGKKLIKSYIEWIGLFPSDRAAAKAYDERARKLGKKRLNCVNPRDWDYFVSPTGP